MNKLLVAGTVAIDSVETPFGNKPESFGGSAAYFAYSASFFTSVKLLAVVGEDFPEEYKDILRERKIELEDLVTVKGKTFRWKGKYEYDLNSAQTLDTQLNVLLDFQPKLAEGYNPEYLFLANIDPELQLSLINQVDRPKTKLIACDTMNFWIQNKIDKLVEVLKHVDMIIVNDAEARDFTGQTNLVKAAKLIKENGPDTVIIKKGEHGVFLFHENKFFSLPGYPLEEVYDPTGAGDTFAGGVIGYLAKKDRINFENLKKAVAYGSVMASFNVEDFSMERLRRLKENEIEERLELFRKLSNF